MGGPGIGAGVGEGREAGRELAAQEVKLLEEALRALGFALFKSGGGRRNTT